MRRLALALVLIAPTLSCSSLQYQKFKAHGLAVGIGVACGAAAVATGGTAGLVIAGGGWAGGVITDQALEPPPKTRTVTNFVKFRTDPDGKTTQEVRSYVDENPGPMPGGGPDWPEGLGPISWWGEVKRALAWAWWLLVAGVLLGWLSRHLRLCQRTVGRVGTMLSRLRKPKE